MTKLECLRHNIDELINLLVSLELDVICWEMYGWDANEDSGTTWCERNCGKVNDGTCPSRECYLEYLNMKETLKYNSFGSFIREFNEHKISDEMLVSCKKADELFKGDD